MTNQPNLYWRDVVRRGFSQFRPTSADPEAEFLAYAEGLYQQEKDRKALLQASGEASSANLSLYIPAVALLTYGRLEAVEDLLRNLPADRHPARVLARSVDALIPLATNLDALSNPEATLTWINEHQSRLRWSPADGRFRLDDGAPAKPA